MIDKLFAVLGMATLAGFLAIILYKVPEPPLLVILSGVVLMGLYDFYLELFRGHGK